MGADTSLPELVERLTARQREAWDLGDHVRSEDLVAQHPELSDSADSVLELIYNELLLRIRAGDKPEREEFRQRFPDLGARLDLLFEVHGALGSFELGDGSDAGGTQAPAGERPVPMAPGLEFIREVGRGGAGIVWLARQTSLDRVVAVKMLLAGALSSPQQWARLRIEALAVARLRHPNIVQIHEVGETNGVPYLVLEFVAGGTLRDLLCGVPHPARDSAALVETLARAMHYAHEQGVVHRDLKPGNILLLDSLPAAPGLRGVLPKIADFGFARQFDPDAQTLPTNGVTESGSLLGTPAYMAPEQAQGKKAVVGPAADVYALGVILYELVTGRPPFQGETPLDTIQQVVADEPVPPSRLQRKLPRDLATICLKCLEKHANARYPSANALAEDLRRYQAGEPIKARPIGAGGRFVKWVRRRPLAAATSALGIIMVAVTAAAGLWRMQAHALALQERKQALAAIESSYQEAQSLRDQAEQQPWQQREFRHAAALAAQRTAGLAEKTECPADLTTRIQDLVVAVQEDEKHFQTARRLEALRILQPSRLTANDTFRGVVTEIFEPGVRKEFRELGVDIDAVSPAGLDSRLPRGHLRSALAAALDHWALLTMERHRNESSMWQRILRLAQTIDPDEGQHTYREALFPSDARVLQETARNVDVEHISPSMAYLMSAALVYRNLRDDSNKLLFRVRDRHPEDYWLNIGLALRARQARPARNLETIRYATAAQSVRPDAAYPHDLIGTAQMQLGQHDLALQSMHKAVALSRDAMFQFDLGLVAEAAGKHEEALTAYREVLAHSGEFEGLHLVHQNMGQAFRRQGKLDQAIEAYLKALRLKPHFPPAINDLGTCYATKRQFEKAIEQFQEAAKVDPADARPCTNLALAYRELRDYDRAIAASREAGTRNALNPDAHKWLGVNLMLKGGSEAEAVAELREADRLEPDKSYTMANLAAALMHSCKLEEAVRCYRKAETLSAKQPGPILARIKDDLERCQGLLEHEPKFPQVVSGALKPSGASELTWFGNLALYHQKFTLSVRLFEEALGRGTTLNPEVRECNTVQLGQAALLAAFEDKAISTAERSRLRKLALRCHQEEFSRLSKREQPPSAKVEFELRHWLNVRYLEPVRGEVKLAKLPADECKSWVDFWNEVDASIQRIAASRK